MTSLTCAKGLLDWHLVKDKYGLVAIVIKGVDNASLFPIDFTIPIERPTKDNYNSINGCEKGFLGATKTSRGRSLLAKRRNILCMSTLLVTFHTKMT